MAKRKFYLDKRNAKWLGVCSGIARYTGVDATIVRIGVVLLTILGGFPWTLIAYVAAGMIASPASAVLPDEGYSGRRVSTHDLRNSMRDIDRRMADVETYVTSTNTRLAREIEDLR